MVEDFGGDEVVVLVNPEHESPATWWEQYRDALRIAGITVRSIEAIAADSTYIVDRGIFGDGPPAPEWPDTRVRTGLVMGAVQSGKTASMLGITALALDAGVDVVVILAGTRLALWRQTYGRIRQQLFAESGAGPKHRLLPSPEAIEDPESSVRIDRLYEINARRGRRLLSEQTPLVFVVMKNVHHVRAAADVLHHSIYPHLSGVGRAVHVLVLDDEADDGSILDAVVEQGLDPASDALKQIPRHVAALWSRHGLGPDTSHGSLYANYVAYTATPQANLLQADHNPLAPRSFVAALRTPGHTGELDPRTPTYRDPRGLASWYTGGEIFHHSLGRQTFMVDQRPQAPEDDDHGRRQASVARALRAFLVAAAIRAHRGGPRHPRDAVFCSRKAARVASPDPRTMLFHPSALIADHFAAAAEILEWSTGLSHADALRSIRDGQRSLTTAGLMADLDAHETDWSAWLAEYRESARVVQGRFDLADGVVGAVPDDESWGAISDLLVNEIFPNVRLAIINSDPEADDRPQFEPIQEDDGWRAAPDLLTIFVSGNVMARGLTLEGLNTTLFLRTSGDPIADTQQQMQRWFGYRGRHIELCRVFLPPGQRELFEQYHEADEALRRQITAGMNGPGNAPDPMVLEGERFRATGKLVGVTKVPFCPGAAPLVRFISDDGGTQHNLDLARALLQRDPRAITVSGTYRGHLLDEPVPLLEAAELLEGLRYEGYYPDTNDRLSTRWTTIEAQLGVGPGDPAPFFRIDADPKGPTVPPQPAACPYTIAAYLRLWHACLSRKARGLFPTEDGSTPWAALDLEGRRSAQPRFWIGIRSGSAEPLTGPGFDDLSPPVKLMARSIEDGVLRAGWGGRSDRQDEDAYMGDILFDHHRNPSAPALIDCGGTRWRPVGADGLILLQPVKVEGKLPVIAVGVAIPLGGPDQIAAAKLLRP